MTEAARALVFDRDVDAASVATAWIAGRRVTGDGPYLRVSDPGTDEPVGWVPWGDASTATAAVDAASAAWPAWRSATPDFRAHLLRKLSAKMHAEVERLAHLLTREQGKPLAEARGEIAYAASFLDWSAEEARRVHGEYMQAVASTRRILVMRQPLGVIAAITPWNFPAAMITRKLAPALAVGNTAVLKPAEQAPLSALALAELAHEVGFPPGVINVVTGDPAAIGGAWLGDARVRKLSFTGSTEVGRLLVTGAAQHLVRLSLELGGHAPVIVFDDADLDVAVRNIMAAKFRNAGQTCVCPNRLYVHVDVHDELVARLGRAVQQLVVGHGLEPGTQVGPLIDDDALAKVRTHLDDARDKGAEIRTGGETFAPRKGLTARYCRPTLVDRMTSAMQIATEETFGPVLGITTFSTDAEAIDLANALPFGLASYAFTRGLDRALRVAEALDFGIVGINETTISTAQAPFGGTKLSGWGREGGKWGIEEFLETKSVTIG
jgi:succinate-semialdehyde dehydrogenase/glutarate-semialdehyde dehydrogenase